MKSIILFVICILVPGLLICQYVIPNPLSRGPLKDPYLYVDGSHSVPDPVLRIHNAYSKFNKYFAIQNTNLSTVKQKLDSIIYEPTDVAFPNRKSAYEFNNDGLKTAEMEYEWNETETNWYPVSKSEYTYDNNRFLKDYTTFYGDELNWFNELKFELIYDGSYKLITMNAYGWNETTNQWDLGSKIEYTYNTESRLSTSILFEWDATNNKWINSSKTEYEYEPNGFINTITYFSWVSPSWELSAREQFTYYVFGKELQYTFTLWDGSGEWAYYYQTESFYDVNRKLNIHTEFVWDVISVIYVNFKKAEYKYDQFDNMNSAVFSNWVKQLQDFIFVSKEDCVYNNVFPGKELLIPGELKFSQTTNRIDDNEIYFNAMLMTHDHFLHNGTRYIENAKRTFYYSPITITKTTQSNNQNVLICPNPASQILNIKGFGFDQPVQINVYDVNGLLQFSRQIEMNAQINIKDLIPGIYFYKLILDSKSVVSGKFIKE